MAEALPNFESEYNKSIRTDETNLSRMINVLYLIDRATDSYEGEQPVSNPAVREELLDKAMQLFERYLQNIDPERFDPFKESYANELYRAWEAVISIYAGSEGRENRATARQAL